MREELRASSRYRNRHAIPKYQRGKSSTVSLTGARVERSYDRPGTYSEILRVTGPRGEIAYDFAAVQIVDPAHPEDLPPTIHAAFAPTTGLHAGDPVTFKVRTFRTTDPTSPVPGAATNWRPVSVAAARLTARTGLGRG